MRLYQGQKDARGGLNQSSSIGIWRHLPSFVCNINVNYKRNIGFRWPEKRIPTMGVPHLKKKNKKA